MRIWLLVLLVNFVLAAPLAHAAIYKWTDRNGVVHFTDNRSNIPKKYRSQAKRLKQFDEGSGSAAGGAARTIPQPTPQGAAPAAPATPSIAPPPSAAPATAPALAPQPAPAGVEPAAPTGGHDELWWRSRFAALRNELKSLQDDNANKQAQLIELRRERTLYHRPSDRDAINQLQDQISANEVHINEVLNEISALELSAARAGVPNEWRQ